jgi:Rhodopirellula transposase DDE domain
MAITEELRGLVVRTAGALKQGAQRRQYMADTVSSLALSQRQAQALFGWGRDTLRKALHERRAGIRCCDAFCRRGRKPAEHRLPHLLEDIRELVQDQCQTDGTFRTTRLYCRLSAAQVRRQLIDHKGYSAAALPSVQTITTKLNGLGFRLRKVAKCRPQKKCPRPMPSSPT